MKVRSDRWEWIMKWCDENGKDWRIEEDCQEARMAWINFTQENKP